MEDPRLEEILNRLDAMERALDELRDRRGHDDRRSHDSRGPEGGQAFHEKRVVDLIVRLVAERVDELLWRHLRERQGTVASQERAHDEGEGTTEA